MHVRGLRRFCSVLGGKRQEYVDISTLANAEMDKIGQIRRTAKWRRSRNKIPLQAELLPAACILPRYLSHFDASSVHLIGPDPRSSQAMALPPSQRFCSSSAVKGAFAPCPPGIDCAWANVVNPNKANTIVKNFRMKAPVANITIFNMTCFYILIKYMQ
jgi:hypothetical protein